MAKIFQVTAILNNRVVRYNPVSTVYLNTKNVAKVVSTEYTDNAGAQAIGSLISYTGYDNTFVQDIIVTEPPSTVGTRMNAANTTDVHKIDVTIIDPFAPTSGYIAQSFKSKLGINVDDIWMVMVHPQNSSNALLSLQNETRSVIASARTEETAAAIASAANA